MKILVYGFGNPGRQDDGLGVLLAEHVEQLALDGVTADSNYQLNAEDALEMSSHEVVIFVDASYNDVEPFRFTKLVPAAEVGFSTHAMSPGAVLALCHELYDAHPDTYLLEMKGYEWEMAEGLTDKATANLDKAEAFVVKLLKSGDPAVVAAAATSQSHGPE